MSYNLVGNFFINNKKVSEVGLDKLKILNTVRYSSEFKDIDSIPCPEGIIKNEEFSSSFYNANSFRNALPEYEKKYEEYKDKINSLNAISNSIEYYKLNSEQKDDLLQEKCDYEELLEDMEYEIDAIKFIIHIFEYLSELKIDDEYWRNEDKIFVEIMVC